MASLFLGIWFKTWTCGISVAQFTWYVVLLS